MDDKPEIDAEPLKVDDIYVGQKFQSGTHIIDASQIKAFAREFDPQPFHLDENSAKSSLFGGLVASGWQTAAISMKLLVKSIPFPGGIIGAKAELSWPNPTRPGDTLHVEGEVLSVSPSRSNADRLVVTVRNVTKNQKGQDVQILVSKLVVPKC